LVLRLEYEVLAPTLERLDSPALSDAVTELRERVLLLERRVRGAHDDVVRANAELDVAVRERNRLIFQLEHLGADAAAD
jgi:hypothetical protein